MAELRPVPARGAAARRARARGSSAPGCRSEPTPVHEALDDAARILDESIAQPRPRYFAFIGSCGLEIGAIADLLAHTYDINLAVDARAATQIEHQAVRWVGRVHRVPGHGRRVHERRHDQQRDRARGGARARAARARGTTGWAARRRRRLLLGRGPLLGHPGGGAARASARTTCATLPLDGARRIRPDALAEALDRDIAAGIAPVAVVATAGTTLTGAIDPIDEIADVCAERGVWLHVDGAYGLPAAAGADARGAVRAASQRADSVLGRRPQVAVPAEGMRRRPGARARRRCAGAFAHEQGYLPHQQHELHAVDITLEYSRPFRALKLWLAFRAHGARAVPRGDRPQPATRPTCSTARARRPRTSRSWSAPPQLSIVPIRHAPAGVADLDAHNQRARDGDPGRTAACTSHRR